jgi:6-phosphogluconolactonase (cycloisomerase 2 family)
LPHVASAGSVVLSDDGQWLLVVNAGSDEVSLFAVEPDGLRLAEPDPLGR